MALIIKTQFNNSSSFVETITLDNKIYEFQFDWNVRDEHWSMMIRDKNNQVIVSGIKIVADYELISMYRYLDVPPGYLIAVDTSGQGLDPGFDDFGTRVLLMYFSQGEIDGVI